MGLLLAALLGACGDDDVAPLVDAGDAGLDAEALDAALDGGRADDAGATEDSGVDGGAGNPRTYIKASNTGLMDWFGTSVSLSGDGTRLAVGARTESSGATGIDGDQGDGTYDDLFSGAVYVFLRSGTTWTQEAYIKASNTGGGDEFGTSVSLSADGTRLAVGAPNEESSATGVGGDQTDDSMRHSGAVYVFVRTGTGWAQEAYVKASNTGGDDAFGVSVALSGDGARLAVGAFYEDSSATGIDGNQVDDFAIGAGAAYVFSRTASGWAQEAYIKASNTRVNDRFGGSVSLSGDGARLAVGAVWEDSSATGIDGDQLDDTAANSGAAYLFARAGAVWTQEAYVKASNTDPLDEFGHCVSLSADGSTLAVGAYGEASVAQGINRNQADDSAEAAGAVYVFSWSTAWAQQAYVKGSNTGRFDTFGEALSLSADGNALAVGASGEGDGAVYVFARSATTWTQRRWADHLLGSYDSYFGRAVSISQDGALFAVGVFGDASSATGIDGDETDAEAPDSGAVYVYY